MPWPTAWPRAASFSSNSCGDSKIWHVPSAQAHNSHQQFIQLSSANAIILGWSHWPCTDMGVGFGTLEPGQTGKVTGQLEFLEKPYVPI